MVQRYDTSAHQRVMELWHDHPDWVPILEAACAVAERVGPDGEFAGRWVLQEYATRTGRTGVDAWKPGLRRLAAYGLIQKSGESTRGGKRAYYRMQDREEIERTVAELGAP
jgi:hypothetical protein